MLARSERPRKAGVEQRYATAVFMTTITLRNALVRGNKGHEAVSEDGFSSRRSCCSRPDIKLGSLEVLTDRLLLHPRIPGRDRLRLRLQRPPVRELQPQRHARARRHLRIHVEQHQVAAAGGELHRLAGGEGERLEGAHGGGAGHAGHVLVAGVVGRAGGVHLHCLVQLGAGGGGRGDGDQRRVLVAADQRQIAGRRAAGDGGEADPGLLHLGLGGGFGGGAAGGEQGEGEEGEDRAGEGRQPERPEARAAGAG